MHLLMSVTLLCLVTNILEDNQDFYFILEFNVNAKYQKPETYFRAANNSA